MRFLSILIVSMLAASSLAVVCPSTGNTVFCNPKNCRETIVCTAGVRTIVACTNAQMCSSAVSPAVCVASEFRNCKVQMKWCPGNPAFFRSEDQKQSPANPEISDLLPRDDLYDVFENLERENITLEHYRVDSEFRCPKQNGVFTASHDTDYRICHRGRAFAARCDSDDENCQLEPFYTISSIAPTTCTTNGLIGVTTNCDVFEVCCGDSEVVLNCPLKMQFDNNKRTCVPYGKATCAT